jgi:RNA polymerase sigma factor (TIGR02999 family)
LKITGIMDFHTSPADHQESPEPSRVLQLVIESRTGTRDGAEDELFTLCYDQLRGLARRFMSDEPEGHTLQPTALVHEAYLKVMRGAEVEIEDRAHFFRLAARAMRCVLVDHAKGKRAQKRGGDRERMALDTEIEGESRTAAEILALDEALGGLAAFKARVAQVVELRYFGGLTVAETALALGVSERTAAEDWVFARAWLARALDRGA